MLRKSRAAWCCFCEDPAAAAAATDDSGDCVAGGKPELNPLASATPHSFPFRVSRLQCLRLCPMLRQCTTTPVLVSGAAFAAVDEGLDCTSQHKRHCPPDDRLSQTTVVTFEPHPSPYHLLGPELSDFPPSDRLRQTRETAQHFFSGFPPALGFSVKPPVCVDEVPRQLVPEAFVWDGIFCLLLCRV